MHPSVHAASQPDKAAIIMGATGETISAIVRAALARFEPPDPEIHLSIFVRTTSGLDEAIAEIEKAPGLVLHTLSDKALRARLIKACARLGVAKLAAIEPVVDALSTFLGEAADDRPGMQYRINSEYFDRISALDFAISHDDGALGTKLQQADVILTGVSRTSKTPTCIYLAYRGIKAANIPLVPTSPPDPAFLDAIARGVPAVGLTASPSRLSQIRRQRLEAIGSSDTAGYAELDRIREEVAEARLFFERHSIPVIDVTRRSIEETAAEVFALLRQRGVTGI